MGPGVEGSKAVLAWHMDVLLPVMLHQQGSGMSGADGPFLFPGWFAGQLVQADQEAWAFVVVPGKKYAVIKSQGTDCVAPGHLGIAKSDQVTVDPDQLAVMGVPGDVGIAEGNVNGILGNGG